MSLSQCGERKRRNRILKNSFLQEFKSGFLGHKLHVEEMAKSTFHIGWRKKTYFQKDLFPPFVSSYHPDGGGERISLWCWGYWLLFPLLLFLCFLPIMVVWDDWLSKETGIKMFGGNVQQVAYSSRAHPSLPQILLQSTLCWFEC